MPDMNLFEIGGKTVRRTAEAVEDTYMLSEEAFCHSWPVNYVLGRADYAGRQSENILDQATLALAHQDMEEAAHQLRREAYFCSLVPAMALSPVERAARDGLEAIDQHQPPDKILGAMISAERRTPGSKM